MLVNSEPEEECYHSLNWVMTGKAKQKHNGGSEMGKYPPCQSRKLKEPATLMQNDPTSPEVPTLIVEEWYCSLKID